MLPTVLIVGAGKHRPDSWSGSGLWRLWSQWVISISPLSMAARPLLRPSDSWTLVLVSLLVWSIQLQTAVFCHVFGTYVLSLYHVSICLSLNATTQTCHTWQIVMVLKLVAQYAHSLKTDKPKNGEAKSESFSLCLFLFMSNVDFLKAPFPLLFSPPFLLLSPLLSLAPSRQLWSAQKLIFRVLTTMFFLPTAGFHLQSTGGQYLG